MIEFLPETIFLVASREVVVETHLAPELVINTHQNLHHFIQEFYRLWESGTVGQVRVDQ